MDGCFCTRRITKITINSDPFALHLWYYWERLGSFIFTYIEVITKVFGYLIWNNNAQLLNGRRQKRERKKQKQNAEITTKHCIRMKKIRMLTARLVFHNRQSTCMNNEQWTRPSDILSSTFNFAGAIHFMSTKVMRQNCCNHSTINVNFYLYENWWFYCISIYQGSLYNFSQILLLTLMDCEHSAYIQIKYVTRRDNEKRHKCEQQEEHIQQQHQPAQHSTANTFPH